MRPHRRQPTRLCRPGDSPGKNTGVGCHFLLQCMKVKREMKSLSRVRLLVTPWTVVHQAPPFTGVSRQEYWSGVPGPSPSLCLPRAKFFHFLNFFLNCGKVARMVENPPAMRETWVRSLGWEDPLEKGTATHSSILAWRISLAV